MQWDRNSRARFRKPCAVRHQFGVIVCNWSFQYDLRSRSAANTSAEDFLADGIVDFGQRRKIELEAHHLDQPRAELRIERLDQIADIGLVQVADELAQ